VQKFDIPARKSSQFLGEFASGTPDQRLGARLDGQLQHILKISVPNTSLVLIPPKT